MHILFDCSVSAAGIDMDSSGPTVTYERCMASNICYSELASRSPVGASYRGSAAAADEKSSSAYLSIISQQTFIGCWKLNAELSSLLGVSLAQLQKSAPVKVSLI